MAPVRTTLLLGSPLSSFQEARKWAAKSLPSLIAFAIAVHFLFSILLIKNLHEYDLAVTNTLTEQNDNVHIMSQNRLRDVDKKLEEAPNNAHERKPPLYIRREDSSSMEEGDMTSEAVEMDDLYVKHLHRITNEIKDRLHASYAVSCRWRQNSDAIHSEDCGYFLKRKPNFGYKDNHHQAHVVVFNPLEQERILCDGSRIGPASIKIIEYSDGKLSCSDPPRLFPEVPSLQTKDKMDPIQLRFRQRIIELPDFPCDVPCQSDGFPLNVNKRYVGGTPWKIQFSMEGPHYYPTIKTNPRAHRHDEFYSTTSFESEIPLPYFSWEEYGNRIQTPAIHYDDAIKGAVFIAKNCGSRNNREVLAKALIQSDFRVDSVSKCLKNAVTPEGIEKKEDIMRQYLFYLAFENQCENDYITEKLWLTLSAGVVPVYYGAPNVEDHAPPHSVINANSFNNSQDLIQYLQKVASNKTLYESYHTWRKQPLPESFFQKYNFTKVHSTCRTCRWAFSKKYGLGFDHTTQTVHELKIPRKTCYDEQGILTHPFQESWISADAIHGNIVTIMPAVGKTSMTQTCGHKSMTFQAPIKVGNRTLMRTVRSVDGVTDILLDGGLLKNFVDKMSIILRLKTSIEGDRKSDALKALSENHYRFQDHEKRMTILTSRGTEISNPAMGVLELHILTAKMPLQIRVIIEDVDSFYEDGSERTNYFGQLMAEDFLNPLEYFVVYGKLTNVSDWDNQQLSNVGVISPADSVDDDDDAVTREFESKQAIKSQAESIRDSLIEVKKDTNKTAEQLALRAIQKLIDAGVIERAKKANKNGHPGAHAFAMKRLRSK